MTDAVQVYEGDGHPWPGAPLRDFTNMESQSVEWRAKKVNVTRMPREKDERKKLMLYLQEPDNRTIEEIVKLKEYLEAHPDTASIINVKPLVSFRINGEYTSLGSMAAPVYKVTEVDVPGFGVPASFGYNILVEDLDLYESV